jgi:predicted Zn-dependent protease
MAFNTTVNRTLLSRTVSNLHKKIFLYTGSENKHAARIIMGAGLALLLVSAFVGYRWYTMSRAQAAQKHFADCVQEYTKAAQTGSQSWAMIAKIFELGAQDYASTSMAPYFLAYQADALIKDNKLAEAAGVMQNAVSKMSKSNELYGLYALKSALLSMDATGEGVEAVRTLEALARDAKNKQRDAALYYLGRYYMDKGDTARAQETLQELFNMSEHGAATMSTSPWAREAEKLIERVI